MTTSTPLMTAEELIRLPRGRERHELVQGRPVTMPLRGMRDGAVVASVAYLVGKYVEAHGLGEALLGAGVIMHRNPDTVYGPAVSFVARERLFVSAMPDGYLETMPDLVAEVVAPDDMAEEMQAKVEDCLAAGVKLVWVVYPERRSVVVYRSLEDVRVLREGDTLTGEPALPGFRCSVRELFLG
ncbi:MAG: Uma2 family endonuclease [Chloroflexi bacterium]|nr:Uma2 family endonuclease [Chloroflexota bacterium]